VEIEPGDVRVTTFRASSAPVLRRVAASARSRRFEIRCGWREERVLISARQLRRTPDHVQAGVAGDASASEGAVLSHLRLRSTYATRLSAGGVADEWVTQLLR
jgi:hypothetical protein